MFSVVCKTHRNLSGRPKQIHLTVPLISLPVAWPVLELCLHGIMAAVLFKGGDEKWKQPLATTESPLLDQA